MVRWEVVGGADKGGILVREGQDLKSKQYEERLSHGAIIEELTLAGERLNYKVVAGTGPATGWVSLKVSGKEIVKRQAEGYSADAAPAAAGGHGGPADSSFKVDADAELKKSIEAKAEEMKKKDMLNLSAFKYKVIGGPLPDPKFRVIAFHNAGSAESIFTAPGTDLMKWLKGTKQIEMIALDYPGRDKLLKENLISNTHEMAEWCLSIVYDKIADGIPYVVWGHSVGTWVCFETLMLARQIGLPMPKAAFLNAFPAPHLPIAERPWRRSKTLNTAGIKEELMNWDIGHFGPDGAGSVVYAEPAWSETWEPLMRSDFQLYDEYEFKHNGAPKFEFPIHAWHMDKEKLTKQHMVELWKDWTTAEFDTCVLKDTGHLTAFYKPECKKVLFEKVQGHMQKYSGL